MSRALREQKHRQNTESGVRLLIESPCEKRLEGELSYM